MQEPGQIVETYTEEDPEGAMSVVSVETSDDGTTRRTETTVSSGKVGVGVGGNQGPGAVLQTGAGLVYGRFTVCVGEAVSFLEGCYRRSVEGSRGRIIIGQ